MARLSARLRLQGSRAPGCGHLPFHLPSVSGPPVAMRKCRAWNFSQKRPQAPISLSMGKVLPGSVRLEVTETPSPMTFPPFYPSASSPQSFWHLCCFPNKPGACPPQGRCSCSSMYSHTFLSDNHKLPFLPFSKCHLSSLNSPLHPSLAHPTLFFTPSSS